MRTVLLLIASNLFMTVAWYGHLRFKHVALWKVILASWAIAFFEYCLQVPANRWGHGQFDAMQLKVLQEVVTLAIFVGFAVLYLKETPRWNHLLSFALIIAAVYFAFLPGPSPEVQEREVPERASVLGPCLGMQTQDSTRVQSPRTS